MRINKMNRIENANSIRTLGRFAGEERISTVPINEIECWRANDSRGTHKHRSIFLVKLQNSNDTTECESFGTNHDKSASIIRSNTPPHIDRVRSLFRSHFRAKEAKGKPKRWTWKARRRRKNSGANFWADKGASQIQLFICYFAEKHSHTHAPTQRKRRPPSGAEGKCDKSKIVLLCELRMSKPKTK